MGLEITRRYIGLTWNNLILQDILKGEGGREGERIISHHIPLLTPTYP